MFAQTLPSLSVDQTGSQRIATLGARDELMNKYRLVMGPWRTSVLNALSTYAKAHLSDTDVKIPTARHDADVFDKFNAISRLAFQPIGEYPLSEDRVLLAEIKDELGSSTCEFQQSLRQTTSQFCSELVDNHTLRWRAALVTCWVVIPLLLLLLHWVLSLAAFFGVAYIYERAESTVRGLHHTHLVERIIRIAELPAIQTPTIWILQAVEVVAGKIVDISHWNGWRRGQLLLERFCRWIVARFDALLTRLEQNR